ncbi:MAG: ABC transporter permease [Spirochaetaceae bacterium]|nr:ABC transporter permease [Spirochaetaceae bacterium]
MRTLRSALSSLGRSPVKASVMLATVGLGVAVLIFALSISTAFARLIAERLEGSRRVVMVQVSSPEADEKPGDGIPADDVRKIIDTLVQDVDSVAAATQIDSAFLTTFIVGDAKYEIRSVLSVSEAYLDIMDLDVVVGSGFTGGSGDALLSASLAEVLFGSPVAALGQPLQTAVPRIEIRGSFPDHDAFFRDRFSRAYTVRGVFADPDELRRRAYGVADMLVPEEGMGGRATYYSQLRFVIGVTTGRLATLESQVRAAIAARFGDDLGVTVWEGEPSRANGVLESIRSTVRTLSLVVNLLAVLLLATGGVGLLSVMVVEVLSRSRQIALSRAFGARKAAIVREFLARSLIMMGASSALGVALSLFLSAPLTELVVPIFHDVTEVELTGQVITPAAVVAGIAASLGIGGLLCTLPVFSALSAPIAEGIRD